ncbi:MAG TPA: YlxR family protein [Actinomycetota bacterium]
MGGRPEPERTCVGCRRKGARRDLLRIVRGRDGVPRLDPGCRGEGRGAYVHREGACAEVAIVGGALARALRTGVPAREAARLRAEIEREVRQ